MEIQMIGQFKQFIFTFIKINNIFNEVNKGNNFKAEQLKSSKD